MAVRRLAENQPKSFAFSKKNLEWANHELTKYPEGRQASAVIALLWKAQEQEGWVTEPAIRFIADFLGMAYIRVLEVATFYTMFNLEPVGKYLIQLCGTTPCMLRGAEDLKKVCQRRIGDQEHVSADGKFSWREVECLGACVNAPMVQINYDYYEDLTPENFEKVLDALAAGKKAEPGPQIDRQFSAPAGGPTTLLNGNGGSPHSAKSPRLSDDDAKRPGAAANIRDAATPKRPAAKDSDSRK
jgi:NADH-quinone oxidoreductase subunit E